MMLSRLRSQDFTILILLGFADTLILTMEFCIRLREGETNRGGFGARSSWTKSRTVHWLGIVSVGNRVGVLLSRYGKWPIRPDLGSVWA